MALLPPFPDLPAARSFLAQLPLANPAHSMPALAAYYETLAAHPLLPARTLVKALEAANRPLMHVQSEHGRAFLGRAVPLGEREELAFEQGVALWQLVARTFARCAQLDHEADPEQAGRVALILHRCLYFTGLALHDHFRARRELPPGLWIDLYGYYASAEEWGLATRTVPDPQEAAVGTNAASTLVTSLLTELAGPYSFGVRDIDRIRQWAWRWSPQVEVLPVQAGSAPPYVVDLMQDVGLRLSAGIPAGDEVRQLDTRRLGRRLEETHAALKSRTPPGDLGLGTDVSVGQAVSLLEALQRPWTQSAAPRRFRRRPSTGVAKMAAGFEAIHYLISDAPFVQPESVRTYSRAEYETLYAFRHMEEPSAVLAFKRPTLEFPVDDWEILNESANGFRLERTAVGQRVAHGQLLTIRPPDGDRFLLAQAHWLMQEQNGGLIAGIGMLPGTPTAVAVRRTGEGTSRSEPYVRAFLLPAVAAMEAPPALVLPSGWYQSERAIEVFGEVAWRARLESVLDRGSDFERVAFSVAG